MKDLICDGVWTSDYGLLMWHSPITYFLSELSVLWSSLVS
jgi:hypothetical protein